jgi:hypothetical protein
MPKCHKGKTVSFVELNRLFVPYDKAKTEEEGWGPILGRKYGGWLTWPDLEQRWRVAVLAEASSGKTWELKARTEVATAAGRYGFYLTVADLAAHGVVKAVDWQVSDQLEAWRRSDQEAWFYLDSVDEARLEGHKFELALNQFGRWAGEALSRAHVVISSRVTDWRGSSDADAMVRLLPWQPPAPSPDWDETAMDPLHAVFSRPRRSKRAEEPENSATKVEPVTVVALARLGDDQVRVFADAKGARDVARFMREVHDKRAEALTARPGDLLRLIGYWNAEGRLASLAELFERDVTARLLETSPDRHDSNLVTTDQARAAVERLAASMTLGHALTSRASGQEPGPELAAGAIDAHAVLDDLTQAQVNAILRRGIFAPATYGRIRFHHRDVQDFLTACWLHRLMASGGAAEVHDLLFADSYGTPVARPTLRAAAAWLALKETDVRNGLAQRDPTALLELGDPASLPAQFRIALLRDIVKYISEHDELGRWVDSRVFKALVHPDMAPLIRVLWDQFPSSEARIHLLRTITEGAITDCVDLAEAVLLDTAADGAQRTFALHALTACSHESGLAAVAARINAQPSSFPPDNLVELIETLFPTFLDATSMVNVIQYIATTHQSSRLRHLARVLSRKSPSLSNTDRMAVLREIDALCWRRMTNDDPATLPKDFQSLAACLAAIVNDVLKALPPDELEESLIGACALCERFGRRDHEQNPAALVRARPALKRALMWCDVALARRRRPDLQFDVPGRVYVGGNKLWALTTDDVGWLAEDARGRPDVQDRQIAIGGLWEIWVDVGRPPALAEKLSDLARGHSELGSALERLMAAPERDPGAEKFEREEAARRKRDAKAEKKQQADWEAFRERLRADPSVLSDESSLRASKVNELISLHHWLSHAAKAGDD